MVGATKGEEPSKSNKAENHKNSLGSSEEKVPKVTLLNVITVSAERTKVVATFVDVTTRTPNSTKHTPI